MIAPAASSMNPAARMHGLSSIGKGGGFPCRPRSSCQPLPGGVISRKPPSLACRYSGKAQQVQARADQGEKAEAVPAQQEATREAAPRVRYAEASAVETVAEVAAAPSAGCEPFTMSMAKPKKLKKKVFQIGGYTPLECVGLAAIGIGGLALVVFAFRKTLMPEVNDIMAKLKKPAESNMIMQREIRELKCEREKAQERVDDLSARLTNVDSRTEWYTEKLASATAAVDAEKATTSATNAEIDETRQELLLLQREARQMRTEKQKAEERVKDLTERIGNAEARTKWYTDALQSTQAQIEAEMAVSRERTEEVVALKNQLMGLYREFREAKTEKEKAEERVADLSSRMTNSEARTDWYTGTLASNELKVQELEALSVEMDAQTAATQQELMPLYRQLRDVKEKKQKSDQRINDLSGRIENAEARAQWYTEELETAKEHLGSEKERSAAKDEEIAAAKEELMGMYREAREAKETSAEAEKTVEKLQGQIKSNEGRAQWYAREVASLNAQLEPLKAKDSEIESLKKTLSEAGDRVEGVQDSASKATKELAAMKRDLEKVVAGKEAAEANVAQLSKQIIEAEATAERFAAEVKGEREQREDATAAVNKLREVITDVSSEADRADSVAVSASQELGGERQARMEAEGTIITLRSQIESMQELMKGFREEMGLMKERSEKAFNGVQQKRTTINKLHEQIAALEKEAGSSRGGPGQ